VTPDGWVSTTRLYAVSGASKLNRGVLQAIGGGVESLRMGSPKQVDYNKTMEIC